MIRVLWSSYPGLDFLVEIKITSAVYLCTIINIKSIHTEQIQELPEGLNLIG